ncbi:MAG: carboxypeptidase regulatory-like domain-containing protein, partial [Bacteroidales bacterium]|nr:carboxypeptidase regulatory-like domain-containing protein [Bacteroidales bacterium]
MSKFTKLCLWMVTLLLSSSVVFGQGISQEERALMDNPPRVSVEPDAQTQPMPQERATAPKGIYNPDGSRALTNILLSVTVDIFASEASYNLWDYAGGAYYWATDQTFSSGNENQQHVLPLEEGNGFDVDCWDTWGDGGIAGEVSNDDTGWPIMSWSSGDYGSYGAFYFVAGPGTQPQEVTTFPFWATFDDGTIPNELVLDIGSNADVRTDADAAESGAYGLLFEGNTSSGWGSTPYSYSAAFDASKSSHFGTVDITVVPDGTSGMLAMAYDMVMGYSFNSNYAWYRTLINGTELEDENGDYYWQPSSHSDPWMEYYFDLSPWQNDANFTITLQSSLKYYEDYYNQGDIVYLDNLHIWYEVDPGNLEGYTFNGDGLIVAGATVAIEEVGQTTSGNDGYYYIPDVPVGTQEVLAWKDGYNVVSYMVDIFTQQTTYQDIVLTQPTMIINPLQLNETLNPNEFLTTALGILNNGDGPLHWNAEIVYTSDNAGGGVSVPKFEGTIEHTPADPGMAPVDPEGPQEPSPIRGSIIFGMEALANNFIDFDVDNVSGYTIVGPYTGSDFVSGMAFPMGDEDNAYATVYNSTTLYMVERATGTMTTVGNMSGAVSFNDITIDPTDGTLYATDGSTLYSIDPSGPSATNIGTHGPTTLMIGLACDGDGNLWAYDISNDEFYAIDKATGAATTIGSIGFDANYAQSMFYDADADQITMAAYNLSNSSCEIRAVDVTTGNTTLLSSASGNEITGSAMPVSGGPSGGWLSLGQYEGDVPGNGGSFNLPVHFDASGFEPGAYVTADIIFTSTPDVGTTTIPVSMTVIGDALTPPENLEVELVDDVNGYVDLEWEWYGDATFQYFRVERNGIYVGSTTDMEYTDQLPDYGEYCYEVKAVYDEGMTAPAGPECVSWDNPGLFIDPDALTGEVWVDHQVTVYTTIENTGIGTLTYIFPDYDNTDAFSCEHTIEMTDDFGDGWNGGELDVYLDGTLILENLTLSSGSGPEYVYFTAESGQTITTTFSCGSWCYENEYWIYDGEGNVIIHDGANGSNPTGKTGTAYCPQPSFIVDVTPSSGYLGEGATQQIAITYDATDFPPGTYTEWLFVESNDPDHLADSTHNTMIVTQPAMYEGVVSDANTGAPIPGVMVEADAFNTVTDDNGMYELYVDEGTYDVNFDKVGYQTHIEYDTFAMAGIVTPLDAMLYEELYAPGWVTATPNYPDDTECLVEWTVPWGAYEVAYDDGSADDFLVYSVAGNAHAVKFTPAGYPATVMGGSLFVGDGSFPVGSDFIGSTFGIAVMDDDGTDGMPGTVVDSIEVVVDAYGWVDFEGLFATFEDGDFYLAMFQGSVPPNAAPIGIDQSMPTYYRSYTYIGGGADMWSLSAYQDFMIRAIVSGPQTGDDLVLSPEYKQPPKAVYYDNYIATGKPSGVPGFVKSGTNTPAPEFNIETDRDATGYKVARLSNFDPNGSPLNGDTNVLQNNTSNLSYMDNAWGGLPEGWYAYGVAARYSQGGNVWSDYAVSNIVGHLKQVAVTVNVTTTDGSVADSVEIILSGNSFPYDVYTHFTDETATVTFDPVWKGYYDLTVYKPGYDSANYWDQFINSDRTFDVVLGEKRYAPYNLYVDPLTSIATWNEPRITALREGFEGEMFPPAGWTSSTNSCGWYRTDDGSSDSWPIPAWDSYYAVANDDECGSGQDGSVDYLITPPMDLRETGGYSLKFDQFFDGAFGQSAIVEYSLDGGATWEVLQNMSPTAGSWTHEEIDLSQWSDDWNIPAFWIAFHADDNGEWASGWAIDNVEVSVRSDGDWPPMGYHVFLDDAFVVEVQEETYQYLNLQYGVEYTASVGALYTSGL